MIRAFLAALALLAAAPAAAAPDDVVSAAPNAIAVTVYRDQPLTAAQLRSAVDNQWDTSGLAMIAETRMVDLPAGRSRIRFEGVADDIIPASAALSGLPGQLVERNFDYDLLSPGSLIAKAVGMPVTVRRTDAKTGKVSAEPATLRSGPNGVVVVTAHGVEALNCGSGLDTIVFDHLPPDLASKPTLSVVADAPRAGRYQVTLSYLTVRVDWTADYVARLSPDGRSLDLTGWLTLSNRSGVSFDGATTAVVAGHLARLPPDLPNIQVKTVEPACWPMGTTTSDLPRAGGIVDGEVTTEEVPSPAPPPMMPSVMAPVAASAGKAAVIATQLGDYKMYQLGEPTNVSARQIKQVRFIHQPAVTFETLYVRREGVYPEGDSPAVLPSAVVLSLENKPGQGLGLPLPAGMVAVRQPQLGDEMFLGEHGVRDVPVGEPFELEISASSQVTVRRHEETASVAGGKLRTSLSFELANAKSAPAIFELRQDPSREGFTVVAESASHTLKNGADTWRITIPAGGVATLNYTYEAEE